MGVKEVITIGKQFVVKNAPTIMTIIGGVGFVATIFETADRAPKGKEALEKAEQKRIEKGDYPLSVL